MQRWQYRILQLLYLSKKRDRMKKLHRTIDISLLKIFKCKRYGKRYWRAMKTGGILLKRGFSTASLCAMLNLHKDKNMNGLLSVCGYECSKCDYFKKKECTGCNQIQGKAWWVGYVNASSCPIYDCVKNHKIDNCGLCSELPCKLWYDLKDPNFTEEQQNQSIIDRVERLKIEHNA